MFKQLFIKIKKFFYGEINYYRKQGMKIGDNCTFLGNVKFGSEPYLISLGNNVRITDGVSFITHDGGVHVIRNLYNLPNIDKIGKITVKNNVFIGVETIIMPNVTIGNNVIIGAGSIITNDVDDNSVVAGVPAKKICNIEDYYNKNKENFIETKHLNFNEKKEYLINLNKIEDSIK